MSVDQDWNDFQQTLLNNNSSTNTIENNNNILDEIYPKCSEIYISTKTKIGYLNISIDLNTLFWKIPITDYSLRQEGILKKQMKMVFLNNEEEKKMEQKFESENIKYGSIDSIIKKSSKKEIPLTKKINIGICSKDIGSNKKKKKGAFYNCFAIILRVLNKRRFQEIHIKIFNTGKLEIPGIQDNKLLIVVLDKLVNYLQPFYSKKIYYYPEKINTVLINSNFTCHYYIDRDELFDLLKGKYNLHVLYDPCSYPGIQCKFYYNSNYKKNNGLCKCEKKCTKKQGECSELSFMIFRTGSVLIVGNCDEDILRNVYLFIKNLLEKEYHNIAVSNNYEKKKKKVKKKKIINIRLKLTN